MSCLDEAIDTLKEAYRDSETEDSMMKLVLDGLVDVDLSDDEYLELPSCTPSNSGGGVSKGAKNGVVAVVGGSNRYGGGTSRGVERGAESFADLSTTACLTQVTTISSSAEDAADDDMRRTESLFQRSGSEEESGADDPEDTDDDLYRYGRGIVAKAAKSNGEESSESSSQKPDDVIRTTRSGGDDSSDIFATLSPTTSSASIISGKFPDVIRDWNHGGGTEEVLKSSTSDEELNTFLSSPSESDVSGVTGLSVPFSTRSSGSSIQTASFSASTCSTGPKPFDYSKKRNSGGTHGSDLLRSWRHSNSPGSHNKGQVIIVNGPLPDADPAAGDVASKPKPAPPTTTTAATATTTTKVPLFQHPILAQLSGTLYRSASSNSSEQSTSQSTTSTGNGNSSTEPTDRSATTEPAQDTSQNVCIKPSSSILDTNTEAATAGEDQSTESVGLADVVVEPSDSCTKVETHLGSLDPSVRDQSDGVDDTTDPEKDSKSEQSLADALPCISSTEDTGPSTEPPTHSDSDGKHVEEEVKPSKSECTAVTEGTSYSEPVEDEEEATTPTVGQLAGDAEQAKMTGTAMSTQTDTDTDSLKEGSIHVEIESSETLDDPWEWAYEVWGSMGLMRSVALSPASSCSPSENRVQPKPRAVAKKVSTKQGSSQFSARTTNSVRHLDLQGVPGQSKLRSIEPTKGRMSLPAYASVVSSANTKEGGKQFASVLKKWQQKNDDNPKGLPKRNEPALECGQMSVKDLIIAKTEANNTYNKCPVPHLHNRNPATANPNTNLNVCEPAASAKTKSHIPKGSTETQEYSNENQQDVHSKKSNYVSDAPVLGEDLNEVNGNIRRPVSQATRIKAASATDRKSIDNRGGSLYGSPLMQKNKANRMTLPRSQCDYKSAAQVLLEEAETNDELLQSFSEERQANEQERYHEAVPLDEKAADIMSSPEGIFRRETARSPKKAQPTTPSNKKSPYNSSSKGRPESESSKRSTPEAFQQAQRRWQEAEKKLIYDANHRSPCPSTEKIVTSPFLPAIVTTSVNTPKNPRTFGRTSTPNVGSEPSRATSETSTMSAQDVFNKLKRHWKDAEEDAASRQNEVKTPRGQSKSTLATPRRRFSRVDGTSAAASASPLNMEIFTETPDESFRSGLRSNRNSSVGEHAWMKLLQDEGEDDELTEDGEYEAMRSVKSSRTTMSKRGSISKPTTPSRKSSEAFTERPWRRDMMLRQVDSYDLSVTERTPPAKCTCADSVFSGKDEFIEFYLPLMGMACTCGARQSNSSEHTKLRNPEEPSSLENILRTWQVEFLGAFGIYRGDQLVKAHHRSATALANAMRKYRKKQGMTPFPTKSCKMALAIWAKTSKSFVRSIRKQLTNGITGGSTAGGSEGGSGNGELKIPNTLYILSSFLEKISNNNDDAASTMSPA